MNGIYAQALIFSEPQLKVYAVRNWKCAVQNVY